MSFSFTEFKIELEGTTKGYDPFRLCILSVHNDNRCPAFFPSSRNRYCNRRLRLSGMNKLDVRTFDLWQGSLVLLRGLCFFFDSAESTRVDSGNYVRQ